ncbi:Transposase [Aeromonas bestiarum]
MAIQWEETKMRTRRRTTLVRKAKCAWSPRRKLKLNDIKRKIWRRNRSYTLLIAEHTE